jgi:hypothetical protein
LKFISKIQRGAIICNVEGAGGNVWKKWGLWGRISYKNCAISSIKFVLFTDHYWDDHDPDVRMYLVPWDVTEMGTKIWSET